jgi:hypothetical protein
MSEDHPQENVEAVGLSSANTVHFVKMENGTPELDGEIKQVNGKTIMEEGYKTFCGKLLDKDSVFVENADEKVDEFVDKGKHFCKSCRSSVRFYRGDIERTD